MAIVTTNIRQSLSTTSVTMLAVASISSPIGLVIMAQYGETSLFYYALVILTFFIPASFIFSNLGASFPNASGIYGWVKLAFGEKLGNIAIWSQWLGVIISFPIILSFALSIFLYPFDPHLIKEGHVIVIGSVGLLLMLCGFTSMLSVYLISLAKGVQASAKDGLLPRSFAKENRYGIPTHIVITLSGVAMLVTLLFVLLPSVHAAYWLIEAVVIIGSSLRYLMVFPAAIKLHYKKTSIDRTIKIPGGTLGVWCMAGAPLLMVLFAICMTFVPPQQFSIGSHADYDVILAVGTSLFVILPLAVGWYSKKQHGNTMVCQ